MVGSWISQIITLLGNYVSWLFTLYIADGITVGETILFFAVAILLIIFIKRLAHAGSYEPKERTYGRNSNND